MRAAIAAFAVLAGCARLQLLPKSDPEAIWLGSEFRTYRQAGLAALQKGDYRTAILQYTAGAEAARQSRDLVSRGRFLTNLSAAYLLQFDNRSAIQTLLAARTAANAIGDLSTLQTVEASLANVYIQTGDPEAAGAAAIRGAAIHPLQQRPESRITILVSFARAISRTRGLAAAEPAFREAYQEAGRCGLVAQEAEILDLWGNEAVETDLLRAGEDLLARAWVKRKLAHDPRITLTEGKLGRLYRKLGKYQTAHLWMDRVRSATAGGKKIAIPEWLLVAEQGHILSGEDRLPEALATYREALEWARKWRAALPPAERLRLGAEHRLQELFEGHLRTAARSYRRRPDPSLSAEMFTLIQTTRAWSLEKHRDGSMQDDALSAQARRLESQWLSGNAAAETELRAVRASILERESERADAAGGEAAGRLREPPTGVAILTFWLDDAGSWLWLWTSQGLRVTPLPGRAEILQKADAFQRAVAENRPTIRPLGDQLMHTLLGNLRAECLQAKRWDIVADDGLFGIPFAALPAGDGAFLVEKVELRLIPNALQRRESVRPSKRFLAIADPIFNSADERRAAQWHWLWPVHAGQPVVALPRLPGTRREAETARGIFQKAGFETAVQLGADSGEETVLARLAEWQPGIVHFATHTVTPAGGPARPRLALSLRSDGTAGLLSPEDISVLALRADLVVMSACHSTGAETAPGSGLLGLTRAWLTGGARQVMATLWPIGDDATAFFETFYRSLAVGDATAGRPATTALRQAQLACLRGGGISAEPRFWAGYVLLARR